MTYDPMTPTNLRHRDRWGRERAAELLRIRDNEAGPLTPLEKPDYSPRTLPTPDGGIPPEVEHWGAPSQRRWFARFNGQLRPRPARVWDRFFVESARHRGMCCESCLEDSMNGDREFDPERCCCRAAK